MVAIALDSLPPVHELTTADESVVLVTERSRLPFQHVPDPQVEPRLFRGTWRNVSGSVARAIRAHCMAHHTAPFRIRVPRTGELVTVMWRSFPTIQWVSAAWASTVTAELEEIPAYD